MTVYKELPFDMVERQRYSDGDTTFVFAMERSQIGKQKPSPGTCAYFKVVEGGFEHLPIGTEGWRKALETISKQRTDRLTSP